MDYKEYLSKARELRQSAINKSAYNKDIYGSMNDYFSSTNKYEQTIKQLKKDLQLATDAIFKHKKQKE